MLLAALPAFLLEPSETPRLLAQQVLEILEVLERLLREPPGLRDESRGLEEGP